MSKYLKDVAKERKRKKELKAKRSVNGSIEKKKRKVRETFETGPEQIERRAKSGNKIWVDDYIYFAFDYGRVGFNDTQLAKVFGISVRRLHKWYTLHPVLKRGVEHGRALFEKNKEGGFKDYVYRQLSDELRTTWDHLVEVNESGNSVGQIEALLQNKGKLARQHLLVHAIVNSSFDLSHALKMVNVSFRQYTKWLETDPDFANLVSEIQFHKKNFIEGALMDLVTAREKGAVVFANRTLNADRGYGNKMQVEHSGTITHNHTHVSLGTLDLPSDVLKQILRAKRRLDASKEEQMKLEFKPNANLSAQQLEDFKNGIRDSDGFLLEDQDDVIDVEAEKVA